MKIARTIRKLAGSSSSAVPASTVRPLEYLSAQEQRELACLRDRAARIDARLASIDGEIARARSGSFEAQELGVERNDLHAHARITANRITDLLTIVRRDERRDRIVEANVAARQRGLLASIERNARTGDHRQARLERMMLIDIRSDVERELGGGPR